MPANDDASVIVIGAGAAGLSSATALAHCGIDSTVIDQDTQIGGSWRRRYDALRLHTTRRFSGLAHFPIPKHMPQYLSKNQFAEYLQAYAETYRLDVRLGERLDRLTPPLGSASKYWQVETSADTRSARAIIVATGLYSEPYLPAFPGLVDFAGVFAHSSSYTNATAFGGSKVLVIGLGNSGAEIAADLAAHGAGEVLVAVRTPPPIVSREMFGFFPAQVLGIALSPLKIPRIVDRVGAAQRRLSIGDLGRYGIGRAAWGPFTAQRPPVIDTGFIEQLKRGRITIRTAVDRFDGDCVVYDDGTSEAVDAVIAATGFSTGLDRILPDSDLIDIRRRPSHSANERNDAASVPGLYFVGFKETIRGQLNEIKRQSLRVAAEIERDLAA